MIHENPPLFKEEEIIIEDQVVIDKEIGFLFPNICSVCHQILQFILPACANKSVPSCQKEILDADEQEKQKKRKRESNEKEEKKKEKEKMEEKAKKKEEEKKKKKEEKEKEGRKRKERVNKKEKENEKEKEDKEGVSLIGLHQEKTLSTSKYSPSTITSFFSVNKYSLRYLDHLLLGYKMFTRPVVCEKSTTKGSVSVMW